MLARSPARRAVASGVAVALLALGVACESAIPAEQGTLDPCTELGLRCSSCTKASDQEQCNQALMASDPNQCTVLLSNTAFLADCPLPRDGGVEASAHDAAPLQACGTTASADAGCACDGGCTTACPGGGCTMTCASGTCTPTCAGGGCLIECLPGATCEASCAGGNCRVDCKPGSTCANSCAGGGCNYQCEVGAVCNDTCGSANNCLGM